MDQNLGFSFSWYCVCGRIAWVCVCVAGSWHFICDFLFLKYICTSIDIFAIWSFVLVSAFRTPGFFCRWLFDYFHLACAANNNFHFHTLARKSLLSMHGFPRAFHLAPPFPASRHLGHAAFTAFTAFAAAFSTVSTAFQHGPTHTRTHPHTCVCARRGRGWRGRRTNAKQQLARRNNATPTLKIGKGKCTENRQPTALKARKRLSPKNCG